MARGYNSVHLIGSLTQDPSLRYTSSGLSLMELPLAGVDTVVGTDGTARELTWYHRVTVFAGQAEYLDGKLQAGEPVFVDGRLNYRSWEQDGQKRSALDIKAVRVDPLTFGARTPEARTLADAKGQHRLLGALNRVTLVGNLIKDADVRYVQSGDAVARIVVAVNEQYRDKRGQDQESVHFVEVTAWRSLAEACGALSKGDPVLVVGRFVTDSWTGQDGTKNYKNKIEASEVEFLTRAGSSPATKPTPARPAATATPGLDIDEEFPPEEDLPF